jgi:hypothetical protein
MKRLVFLAVAAAVLVLVGSLTAAYAQGTFKVPFEFKAGGKKLPAGEYWVGQKGEKDIALRKLPDGAEVLVPFTQRLETPKPSVGEPQLVFDAVGNFEPSYTEYVTEYVLAELWLPGADGFLVHTTKGAHQRQTVKGKPAE